MTLLFQSIQGLDQSWIWPPRNWFFVGQSWLSANLGLPTVHVCLSVVCLSVVCLPVVCLSVVCLSVLTGIELGWDLNGNGMELGWDLKGTVMELEWNIESVNCRLQVCSLFRKGSFRACFAKARLEPAKLRSANCPSVRPSVSCLTPHVNSFETSGLFFCI